MHKIHSHPFTNASYYSCIYVPNNLVIHPLWGRVEKTRQDIYIFSWLEMFYNWNLCKLDFTASLSVSHLVQPKCFPPAQHILVAELSFWSLDFLLQIAFPGSLKHEIQMTCGRTCLWGSNVWNWCDSHGNVSLLFVRWLVKVDSVLCVVCGVELFGFPVSQRN